MLATPLPGPLTGRELRPVSNLGVTPSRDQANHPPSTATCISCGAPYGSAHYAWCKFTIAVLRLFRGGA